MTEEDYKSLLSVYQQRSFDLFNANVLLETQIAQLKKQVEDLQRALQSTTSVDNGSDDF
jgi:dynactin complex subunit